MWTSKAPAYFALVCAVAIGVLLSGANRSSKPDASAQLDVPSTSATVASSPAESPPVPVIEWKSQTLNLGSLRLKASLPSYGVNAKCMLPGPADDEVAMCQPSVGTTDTSIWQIRTVSQRDRYVPISWFDSAIQALRVLPPDVLTRQLGNEANRVSKAGFTNAALLSPVDLPGAVGIRGAAAAPSSFSATASQSCVYAFFLAANKPTTLLYCATDEAQSLAGSQKIVSSLLKLNVSGEYKRGSAQGTEHALYLKRLKAAGGAAGAPELVSSEQSFEQMTASECEKYPVISQERFQCYEGFAASRLSAL
ncbi:hypothetical protein [Burkholderia sp. 9120]|nr:hypothetical protein [Burkholderia sp. 9120]